MSEVAATSAPFLSSELWLIGCDGRARFKWSLAMMESYLPNIKINIKLISTGAGNAIGIILEDVSSDVLTKIHEFMHFLFQRRNTKECEVWFLDFFTNLDADMMKKLKSEAEKRKVQLADAGAPGRFDSAMQLLGDFTANLCSICVDQQQAQIRATRSPDFNRLLFRMVRKIHLERADERGYFGNV